MGKAWLREYRFARGQCDGSRRRSGKAGKWSYPDFLQALFAVKRLSKTNNIGNPIMLYHCDICDAPHVGHMAKEEAIVMYGGWSENIRELQGT